MRGDNCYHTHILLAILFLSLHESLYGWDRSCVSAVSYVSLSALGSAAARKKTRCLRSGEPGITGT